MADTIKSNEPDVRFLHGDEIVLYPNGTFARSMDKLFNRASRYKVGVNSNLDAIAIWKDGELPTENDLERFKDPDFIAKIIKNHNNLGNRIINQLDIAFNAPHILPSIMAITDKSTLTEQKKQITEIYRLTKNYIHKIISIINKNPDLLLETDQFKNTFTNNPIKDKLLSREDFAEDKKLLIEQSVFTDELRSLFAYSNIPIMFAPDLNKILNITEEDASFFITAHEDALVLDHQTLSLLKSNNPIEQHEVIRNIAKGLIFAAVFNIGLNPQNAGLDKPDIWKDIKSEYKQNCKQIMLPKQFAEDSLVSADYFAIYIISQIHFALNSGLYDANKVRQDFPKSCVMYDIFMKSVKQRVNDCKKYPPHNPYFTEGWSKKEEKIELVNTPQNAKEVRLIEAANEFIADALGSQPSFNQFRCRLILNDNNESKNYPISMTFRNSQGEDMQLTISTGADNLDEAIELKKFFQSYVLNQNGIDALYLKTNRSNSIKSIATDDIMPNEKILSSSVAEVNGYYFANLKYDQDKEINVPLGLKYIHNNTINSNEAQSRLNILTTHLQNLLSNNLRETLGEVTQYLKKQIHNSDQSIGWRVADTQKLSYLEEGEINLNFPAYSAQSTRLKSTIIRSENTGNPTWRLHFTITVNGLGEDGKESKDYHLSHNLHTNDETAAQSRGAEAMEYLVSKFRYLKQTYHDLEWKFDPYIITENKKNEATGRLILHSATSKTPPTPEPQNLFHILEDMPNPKLNFHINHEVSDLENGNKKIGFAVIRGTEAENDLIEYKNTSGKLMRCSFELTNECDINQLVTDIRATFGKAIIDTYGNRTDTEQRKTRQEFRPATIEKLFKLSVDEKMPQDAVKITEIHNNFSAIAY